MEENNIEQPTSEGFKNQLDLSPLTEGLTRLKAEISSVIVGQDKLIKLILAAILADGHVLLEGFPGLAKTLSAKIVAKTMDTDFSRIQFTPDLMPSDVLGTSVYDFKDGSFDFKKGPIFSNIILIDEINRAPAKTQAALFEVMEEKQVTVDGKKMEMEKPFVIIATQNPIDMEGTYSLPEAQLDRFIFKIKVDYPSVDEELKILNIHQENKYINSLDTIVPIWNTKEISQFKDIVHQVRIDQVILKYIANLVHTTRNHKDIDSRERNGREYSGESHKRCCTKSRNSEINDPKYIFRTELILCRLIPSNSIFIELGISRIILSCKTGILALYHPYMYRYLLAIF